MAIVKRCYICEALYAILCVQLLTLIGLLKVALGNIFIVLLTLVTELVIRKACSYTCSTFIGGKYLTN